MHCLYFRRSIIQPFFIEDVQILLIIYPHVLVHKQNRIARKLLAKNLTIIISRKPNSGFCIAGSGKSQTTQQFKAWPNSVGDGCKSGPDKVCWRPARCRPEALFVWPQQQSVKRSKCRQQ